MPNRVAQYNAACNIRHVSIRRSAIRARRCLNDKGLVDVCLASLLPHRRLLCSDAIIIVLYHTVALNLRISGNPDFGVQ